MSTGSTLSEALLSGLSWIAGAKPSLLQRTYTDRTRYAAIGISLLMAAVVAGTAVSVGISLSPLPWLYRIIWLPAILFIAYGLRWQMRLLTVSDGGLWLKVVVVVVLLLSALLLAIPLELYLLRDAGPVMPGTTYSRHSAASLLDWVTATNEQPVLCIMRWAVRLILILIVLMPAYVLLSIQGGAYARACQAKRQLDTSFPFSS